MDSKEKDRRVWEEAAAALASLLVATVEEKLKSKRKGNGKKVKTQGVPRNKAKN